MIEEKAEKSNDKIGKNEGLKIETNEHLKIATTF